MPDQSAEPISIAGEDLHVSGLSLAPPDARACYVLAHGAGAGMAHPFMRVTRIFATSAMNAAMCVTS